MAIRENRYANPALGSAFESIASLFAPVSAQDLTGYAAAATERQKAAQIAQSMGLVDLFTNGDMADLAALDRAGIAAGLYNPTQGYGARDMADATTRRGQDVDLQGTMYTSDNSLRGTMYSADQSNDAARFGHTLGYKAATENNVRDNARETYGIDVDATTLRRGQDIGLTANQNDNLRAVQTNLFDNIMRPVGADEVRPGVPEDILAQFGLGAFGDVGMAEGPRTPLTETQAIGQALQSRMAGEGGDEFTQLLAGSAVDAPMAAVDGNGNQVYMTNADAIGAGVPVDQANAKLVNVQLPDGSTTTAAQTARGLVDPATGAPMPQGTTMFSSNVQGGKDDVLTTSTSSQTEQRLLDLQAAEATTAQLRSLVENNPSLQGIPGTFQSFVQNVAATAGEIGQKFGGDIQLVADMAREEALALGDGAAMQAFDPNLPAVEMLSNILAFQYAKLMTGERLSNEMLRSSREALGLNGWLANSQDTLARLSHVQQMIEQQRSSIMSMRRGGADSLTGAPAPTMQGETVVEGGRFVPSADGVIDFIPN